MKSKRTDAWVQWALEAWERGEALETILAQVPPSARQEVADALEMAQALRAYAAEVRREAEAWQPRWVEVATRIAAEQASPEGSHARGWAWWAPRAVWRWAALAAVVVFALVGMVLPVYAAQALPGDVLYPVKRWSEQVEGWFVARDPEGQQRWALEVAQRRMDEAEALLRQGRWAEAQRVLDEADAQLRALPANAVTDQRVASLRARWRALHQRAAQGPSTQAPPASTEQTPARQGEPPTPPSPGGPARRPTRTAAMPRRTPTATPTATASLTPSPTATPTEDATPTPTPTDEDGNGQGQQRRRREREGQ
ncbi:MAG: hypothetical protein GXO54_05300 [Chloroflexi bacterium]|nr:hypothetical protein [Chloroflexota bacterium]